MADIFKTKQTLLTGSIPAIAGIDDPSQARIVLYQAGRPVHAPMDKVGLLPLAGGTMTGALTTNGQIVFPAAANPSANPNTLDDYEEGLWTPVYGVATGAFTTMTYDAPTNQWGHYTRVGRTCRCTFRIRTTAVALGTASGQIRIDGIPFTSAPPAGTAYAGAFNYPAYSATWVTAWPCGGLVSGGSVLLYTRATTVANGALLTAANLTLGAGNDIIGQFSYVV